MNNELILGNVMVDCDDGKKLQDFYGELLGWENVNCMQSLLSVAREE